MKYVDLAGNIGIPAKSLLDNSVMAAIIDL